MARTKSGSRQGFLGNTVRALVTPPSSQPGEGDGAPPAPKKEPAAKGRNIKIPDTLYDPVCLYALTTKVTVTSEQRVNGIVVGMRETRRSMTVSEAICNALNAYGPLKKYMPKGNGQPPDADQQVQGGNPPDLDQQAQGGDEKESPPAEKERKAVA
jgi:hypothetical protein